MAIPLYRIAQEVLTDVRRHGPAVGVRIRVRSEGECRALHRGLPRRRVDSDLVLRNGLVTLGLRGDVESLNDLGGKLAPHWGGDKAGQWFLSWRETVPIRVLLADDHPMVRDGLRAILERDGMSVVAEASNGRQALELAEKFRPDVAVLDLSMPLLNGIDAAREMGRIAPHTKTIMLTMHTERQFILEGLRAGTRGFLMKSHSAGELVQAIRETSRGGTYFSSEVARAAVEACRTNGDSPADPLTPRERQVLQLVAESKTTKEIAVLLAISVKTVETYRARIMEKLGIHETAGVVRYAIRHGVVQP